MGGASNSSVVKPIKGQTDSMFSEVLRQRRWCAISKRALVPDGRSPQKLVPLPVQTKPRATLDARACEYFGGGLNFPVLERLNKGLLTGALGP
eukprot:9289846-Pyramimonas_sp.AAC.1